MSLINRFPQGLLGLLQTKSTGETPKEFEPRVQLGIEGLPFYLASVQLSLARVGETIGSTGEQFARVDIPAGQT